MIRELAYFVIWGKPVIFYAGIITFAFFLLTAYIGATNLWGRRRIPLYWHFRIAKISLVLMGLHALLGLSAYFNI